MNLARLLAIALESGFTDSESIRTLARSAVVLRPRGSCAARAPGSRLGGLPSLPASVRWPQRDGRSLAFIAQIDLASQPAIGSDQGFPRDGLLLFFYDVDQDAWGFDPKDAGSFAVIHVPDPATTADRIDWPADLPEEARYAACSLVPEETWTLPPLESVLIDDLDLDEGAQTAYQNLLEKAHGDEWASRCLLGGHPDQIQNDMSLECALVAGGLYCGDATAYRDPRFAALRRHAPEWRLLLQVHSADEAGMMWGDMGCLYYWIRADDLAARRFERAWMLLQCS